MAPSATMELMTARQKKDAENTLDRRWRAGLFALAALLLAFQASVNAADMGVRFCGLALAALLFLGAAAWTLWGGKGR